MELSKELADTETLVTDLREQLTEAQAQVHALKTEKQQQDDLLKQASVKLGKHSEGFDPGDLTQWQCYGLQEMEAAEHEKSQLRNKMTESEQLITDLNEKMASLREEMTAAATQHGVHIEQLRTSLQQHARELDNAKMEIEAGVQRQATHERDVQEIMSCADVEIQRQREELQGELRSLESLVTKVANEKDQLEKTYNNQGFLLSVRP
jgi:chromosome segregation ATPase